MLPMSQLPPRLPITMEDEPEAVEIELTPDEGDHEVIYNDDGSAEITLSGGADLIDDTFDANLTETILAPERLGELAVELLDLIDEDIKAREPRDQQYAEGIRRTGMGEDAPGGAEFDGASRAVHPMLVRASIDFASRTIKELFPADGPCKTKIIGQQTEEKIDRAERKQTYMNWQATTQVAENRAEMEKLLSQVPLGGAQYKRWWYDPELDRPRTEAVFIDNVFTPAGHADFYTSPRTTLRQYISRQEFEKRVRTGLYRDVTPGDPGWMGEESKSATATHKIEGVDMDATCYNTDGLRLVYQVEIQIDIEEDDMAGRSAPYIMHIDDSTRMLLGVYRNWDEKDQKLEKLQWMSEWSFIPWRGGQAVGLAHLIGSLAGAGTGALRALLDAALINNFPGAMMLKGAKSSGESKQVMATEIVQIDAPAGADASTVDIRKLVMPFPFNGPSAVLFQLLEWITQQGESTASVAIEAMADARPDMPVGTTLALIEHQSTNFSAIHARLHNAMARDLAILHRIDSQHVTDDMVVEELGELVVSAADFQGPLDIIPVSDPNIFTGAQRYAQLQATMALKNDPAFAPFFKPEGLLRRALKLIQIPDPEGIANLPPEAKRLPPLEENYVASLPPDTRAPLKAYEGQDHIAHLKAHIVYATSPLMGGHPLIAPAIMPAMLEHCKEHLIMLYRQHCKGASEAMMTVAQMQGIPLDQDEADMQAQMFVEKTLAEALGEMVMPGLKGMQDAVSQIMQSQAPKANPDVVLAQQTFKEVEALKSQAKTQETQAKMANDAEERKSTEQLAQLATNVEMMKGQQADASKMILSEFQTAARAQELVLSKFLENGLAPSAPATAEIDQMTGEVAVQPAQDNPAQNALAMFEPALQQALSAALADAAGTSPQMASMLQNVMDQQQQLAAAIQAQQTAIQQVSMALQQAAQPQQPVQPQPQGVPNGQQIDPAAQANGNGPA